MEKSLEVSGKSENWPLLCWKKENFILVLLVLPETVPILDKNITKKDSKKKKLVNQRKQNQCQRLPPWND